MGDTHPRQEKFFATRRGEVSDRLRAAWKATRTTAPDDEAISNALDETAQTHNHSPDA
jgi:hypothetical protein